MIFKVDPAYTQEALDGKIEGTVTLATVIDKDGEATRVRVLKGLGKGLDEEAVKCLVQWRFNPATNRGGQAVAMKATVEINFRLAK